MRLTKFSTQVDKDILAGLRSYAEENGKSISRLVTEALSDYLKRNRVRPAFSKAMTEVLGKHTDLLGRLAR